MKTTYWERVRFSYGLIRIKHISEPFVDFCDDFKEIFIYIFGSILLLLLIIPRLMLLVIQPLFLSNSKKEAIEKIMSNKKN